MSVRLDHIGIITPDCDKSLAFYMQYFDFTKGDRAVISRNGGKATLQFAHLGDVMLEFVRLHEGCPNVMQSQIHFCLRVDDIHEKIAQLKAGGIRFDRPDEIPTIGRTPKHHNAFCYGPAGERIELMMIDD